MNYLLFVLGLLLCQVTLAFGAAPDTNDGVPLEAQMLSGKALVEYLKKSQNLFEVNDEPTPDFKYKIMSKKFMSQYRREPPVNDDNDPDIPENYDPRLIWPNCSSLFTIPDQANCGSCWAVSTAAAISDRLCIASKGENQVFISSADILSCCDTCGFGCDGGITFRAWEYFATKGSVSGGHFEAPNCCRPYYFHPCGQHGNDTFYGYCPRFAQTPFCRRKCRIGFNKSYAQDRIQGKSFYTVDYSVPAIQREIMTKGSVVGSYDVFTDFSHYKSGIYRHTGGKPDGRHAVRIIGWGKENGTDYWLIANSWHDDWGENGYFRMIRGINDCGIEQDITAGDV
nr:Peptidase C1A domain containing protein [Haemonchus contortus]